MDYDQAISRMTWARCVEKYALLALLSLPILLFVLQEPREAVYQVSWWWLLLVAVCILAHVARVHYRNLAASIFNRKS